MLASWYVAGWRLAAEASPPAVAAAAPAAFAAAEEAMAGPALRAL